MASMTFGWPCPTFVHISWLLKSRYRLPSGVQKYTPLAPATGIGSTFDCADHSNSVWRLVRATISSPVIVPRSVSIAMGPPLALRSADYTTPDNSQPPAPWGRDGGRTLGRIMAVARRRSVRGQA